MYAKWEDDMASGTVASTVLAALKTKAAAAVLAGAVVVGGGATAVAVTTGAVHLPGHSTTTTTTQQDGKSDQSTQDGRAQACADNGDAKKLAGDYKAMFGGDETAARNAICQIFIDKGSHAVGFGEIRQALDLAAWIESKGGSTACLTATPTNGNSADAGTPAATGDHGKPTSTPGNSGDHGKPTDPGKPTSTPGQEPTGEKAQLSIPSASAATTQSVLKAIFDAEKAGTPIEKQARACDAPHASSDSATNTGTGSGQQGAGDGTPQSTPEAHS